MRAHPKKAILFCLIFALSVFTNPGQAYYDDDEDCISCQSSEMWDFAREALWPVAMVASTYLQTSAYENSNLAIADAYKHGHDACTTRFNNYLDYSITRGMSPVLPEEATALQGTCNGIALAGNYAGFAGLSGNMYGGFSNPYLSYGYSPQFMAGMIGPNFGAQGNVNLSLLGLLGMLSGGNAGGQFNLGVNLGGNPFYQGGGGINGIFNGGLNSGNSLMTCFVPPCPGGLYSGGLNNLSSGIYLNGGINGNLGMLNGSWGLNGNGNPYGSIWNMSGGWQQQQIWQQQQWQQQQQLQQQMMAQAYQNQAIYNQNMAGYARLQGNMQGNLAADSALYQNYQDAYQNLYQAQLGNYYTQSTMGYYQNGGMPQGNLYNYNMGNLSGNFSLGLNAQFGF